MIRPGPRLIGSIRHYCPAPFPKYNRFFKQTRMQQTTKHNAPLVWVDCEMTGLDSHKDHIIEVCCLLTNDNLELIEEKGYEAVIHYPKEVMDQMNDWCIQHHGDSGLTKKVLESTNTLEKVESELLEYLQKHMQKGTGILAGNSIHQDRIFLLKEFPKVIDFLHYRQVDVSTIKEVGKRHNPQLMKSVPVKSNSHTARADILESISELKWYTENYLRQPQPPKKVDMSKR